MKKTLNKKKIALASNSLLLAATLAGGVLALPVSAASYDHTYNLDVSKQFQEFDGWGLSLSWWATEIGDWTRVGSSGLTKREEIMEAIYGKSGLNLNIARYNVGGGDDPAHTHMTGDRNTPGWKGATKLAAGQELPAGTTTYTGAAGAGQDVTYIPNDKYFYEAEDGSILPWQETPDWKQLWVLDWLQNYRQEEGDLLTEYYSNSPPYWLTRSGCSSGAPAGDKSGNLINDEAHNKEFVKYLLDVYEYLVGQGFRLDNIQPFNESHSSYLYWTEGGDQEGCHFSSEQQVEITRLLAEEMEARGLNEKYGTVYNWGDETNTDKAWMAYTNGKNINPDVINGASRLTYHIYSYTADTAQKMYRAAQQNGQEIHMSEICYTEGSEYDSEVMTTGFDYTQGILNTVKHSGADAYVFWQGVEDMVGQMKSGTNYGLIQGVYYTQEEAAAQSVDLAALGYNYQDFALSKAYYMSGQYTKYINKGYTIVDIDDGVKSNQDGSLAAISPDGQTLVIVKQNKGAADSFKINLNGFKASTVEKIVTDTNHNWAKSAVTTDGSSLIDTVGSSSVTTYVIHGTRTGGEGYFLDDSHSVKKASLAAIQEAFDEVDEEDHDKAYVYATEDIFERNGGDYGYMGTTGNNKGEAWMAYKFYGVGFGVTLPIKSDAGTVSIYVDTDPTGTPTKGNINLGQSEKLRTVIFSDADMEEFEEGWHTVYVKAHNGGWVNFDGIFVKKTNDADDAGDRLMLTNASGRGDTVNFSYRKTGFQGYEIFAEYRTVGGSWIRSEQSFADLKGSVTVLDGTSVQLRLVAVKGEDVQYSPAWVVNLLEVKPGVLYFVDAGTGTEGELSTGAVLGEYQGVSDKAYGEDAATGLKWGYTNSIKTAYEGTEDAMTSMMSLDETGDSALTYKFTMPEAGIYNLALGFYGGGKDWGSRTEAISVTGATLAADTNEVTLVGGSYNAWYATITTSEANAEVTVSLAKKNASEDDPMVSVIVITEENIAIPLYTSGSSNYNSATIVRGTEISIGADLFAEIEETDVTVYLSDGTTAKISAEEEGVSYTVSSPQILAGNDATATFVSREYPGLEVYALYTWHQEGAMVLYYNIDCGYTNAAGTPSEAPGSKQSVANDLAWHEDTAKGTWWGYTTSKIEYSYANDNSNEWSVCGNVNNLTYKMTGFAANEALIIGTGGHLYNGWGPRAYDVKCNGTTVGNINIKEDSQNTHYYDTFECTANADGELTVVFTTTTNGRNPWVGYIKIWSAGGSSEKCATITSDRTTVARDGSVSLRNLEVGATVYVLDENDYILGSFPVETATQSVVVADYLPATSFSLRFMQAVAGTVDTQLDVSEELVVDVPGVTYTIVNEDVKEGEELILTFQPHANGGVTAVTITPPGGVAYDLTEGFYYRAKTNGDYKVTIVANGVVSSQIITITSFADFKEVYSSEGWTADDLTLTFDPSVYGTVTSVIVNGEAIAVNNEGKYVYTATRNGTYSVTVLTKEGYEYVKEYVVTNIDKVTPHLELTFDYTVASNISLGYETLSASGGTLYVSHDGGAREAVTDHDTISLALAGKYEITFANGAGVETQTNVYYVTYGLDKATLASVTRGDDGAISVTGSTVNTKLYRAGETNETASMKAVKAGKYYLELDNGAEKEIVVFNVAAAAGNAGGDNTDDGGSSVESAIMIAGIVIGCVAIAAAAAVCPVVILKGRKRS